VSAFAPGRKTRWLPGSERKKNRHNALHRPLWKRRRRAQRALPPSTLNVGRFSSPWPFSRDPASRRRFGCDEPRTVSGLFRGQPPRAKEPGDPAPGPQPGKIARLAKEHHFHLERISGSLLFGPSSPRTAHPCISPVANRWHGWACGEWRSGQGVFLPVSPIPWEHRIPSPGHSSRENGEEFPSAALGWKELGRGGPPHPIPALG